MSLNLASNEFTDNPYEMYAHLRAHDPVAQMVNPVSFIGSTEQSYFVSRYQDVVAVLKDPRFSNEVRKVTGRPDTANKWWMPSIIGAFLNSLVMMDDPDHARLRNLVHKGFTPHIIQQMDQQVEAICNELLDKAAQKQTVDLIADFALPLPLNVISEMMGVPPKERHRFHELMATFLDTVSSMSKWSMLLRFPNAMALNRFFRKLIALKRENSQDDLITNLVQAEEQGDSLTEDELAAMLFLLLLAGHETTVNLIGNGTLALLEHPDQMQKLVNNLDLMDTAVEEMLRFTNPVQQVAPRYALEDVELGGHLILKGSHVSVGIASANRDETVFPNPDQFDITRAPNRHVAFGFGIHYCLGAPLARLEGQIAFNALLSRYPEIKLAVPANQLQWRNNQGLRGLRKLPVYLK